MAEKKILKSDLEPSIEVLKVKSDNMVYMEFDKLWKNEELEKLNIFVLRKKKAYANIKLLVLGYINYFIEHYDPDHELETAYLNLKFQIDENKRYKEKKVFISDLYAYLMSDEMVEKIEQMTEDLYHIDLESSSAKKKSSNNIDYSETLQFNNTHGKIIMNMSVAIKIMIPIVSHYLYKMQFKKVDKFIYKCFKDIYKKFQGEYEINNKLYETILSRVLKTSKQHQTIWEQGNIRGIDYENQSVKNFQKLYVDILPKLTYSGNVVHYCIRSMDNSVGHEMNVKYKINYAPVSGSGDADGLTGFEKMEMHTSKFDESILIQNKLNIKQTLKKLQKRFAVEFDKDELDYYVENLNIRPFQRELLFQYFAKYFGSSRELCSCNKRNVCKLIVLLKKILEDRNYQFLQHILSGTMVEMVEPKRSVRKKQMLRVMNSERYKNLMDYKYNAISSIFSKKKNKIEEYIIAIINGKFTLVDYKYRKDTGRLINNSKYKDLICDELLRFIDEI